MSDARPDTTSSAAPQSTARLGGAAHAISSDRVICERCHAELFRMHAVWRCPACGYKTACYGW